MDGIRRAFLLLALFFSIVPVIYAFPSLGFNPPTESNGASISSSHTAVNMSVSGSYLEKFRFSWDNLGYTFIVGDNSAVLYSGDYDQLVLALPFSDGTGTLVRDASGYGNNCNIGGSSANWVTGYYGNALSFNGGYKVDCGNKANLNVGKDLTLEVWFKTQSSGGTQYLVDKLTGGSGWDTGYGMIMNDGYPELILGYDDAGGTEFAAFRIEKPEVHDGNWHYVAFVAESDKTVAGFFDGDLFAKWPFPHQIKPNAKDLFVGGSQYWEQFSGSIDELRIYKRPLSPDEVMFHYRSELSKKNSNEWDFYTDFDLWTGTHTFYGWANDTSGNYFQSDIRTLSVPCIVPSKGMRVIKSTLLCPGTYNIKTNGDEKALSVVGSELTLSGDHTEIFGDSAGKGIYVGNTKNVVIEDLRLADYVYSVYLDHTSDSALDNLTLGRSNWRNVTCGVYTLYTSNVTIENSVFQNFSNYGLYLIGTSHKIINNSFSQRSISAGRFDVGIECQADSGVISGNVFDTLDVGVIFDGSDARNMTVKSNYFTNMTTNADSYDVGVFIFQGASNITVSDNTFDRIGTAGVFIQKNCRDIQVLNNVIDLYNMSRLSSGADKAKVIDDGEPPSGIFITAVYKRWLSDCTESFSDGISKIRGYSSRNIRVAGNSFGPNVQVALRIQGGINVTNDLGNCWYRKIQLPAHLTDVDEYYVPDSIAAVKQWSGSETDVLYKGYGDYASGSSKVMIQYKLNKSVMSFRNMASGVSYSVSLSEPRNLLFNTNCMASAQSVNVSLPVDMLWYRSINFTVTPSDGVSSVYVSTYSPNSVHWTLSGPGTGSVDNLVCGLIGSGLYNASSGGALDRVIRATPDGCVDYGVSASSSARSLDIVYLSGSGPDFSVSSTGIGLSNNSPMVGQGVSVFVNVSNLGGVGVDSSVRCYDGLPGVGLLVWSGNVFFPAYSAVQVSFPWIPSVAGSRTIYFVVDEEGRIDESNEGNNVAARAFTVQPSGSTTTSSSTSTTPSTGSGTTTTVSPTSSTSSTSVSSSTSTSSTRVSSSTVSSSSSTSSIRSSSTADPSTTSTTPPASSTVSSTTTTSTTSTSTTTSTIPLSVLKVLGTGRGTSPGKLYDPSDVAVDSKGNVYVLEAYNGRIQEFGPDGSSYNIYGSSGSLDPGQLDSPDSIALREAGAGMTEIAVADTFNHRVQILWLDNSYPNWTAFGQRLEGVYRPTTHIYFEYPRGVDLGSDGRILVSDTGDDRVDVFVDSEWGKVPKAENRSELNGSSTPEGLLAAPTGIAAEGDVFFVADSGADRIRGFYANGSEFLVFGGAGNGRGGFNAPGGIALDHKGRIYIADTGNNRVVVYTTDGRYVTSYGSTNCSGAILSRPYEAMGQFCSPRGLDVRDGMLYVADSGNHRVQVINVTALPEPSCILLGDEEPCGRIEISEILDLITRWAWGGATVTDVIQLITAWAGH